MCSVAGIQIIPVYREKRMIVITQIIKEGAAAFRWSILHIADAVFIRLFYEDGHA